VVGVTDKMVFVREVEIPPQTMEGFSTVIDVEEVPVTGLKVDGEAATANLLRVRATRVGDVFGSQGKGSRVGPLNCGGPPAE
jgi:hypothetical protein